MPRFELDRRTLQFELVRKQKPTANELFLKVRREHGQYMKHHGIEDKTVRDIVTKVLSGTRNSHYLTSWEDYRKLQPIIDNILAETRDF